ncbi:uncharacterized protein C20orf202 homolog [Myotis myotis]|nr:uncharacterized protein C20orf202 homolog [Myotis myotis]
MLLVLGAQAKSKEKFGLKVMGSWEDSVAASVASGLACQGLRGEASGNTSLQSESQRCRSQLCGLVQKAPLAELSFLICQVDVPLPGLINFILGDLARLCFQPEAGRRLCKSTVRQAHHQASVKVSPKDTEMKTAEEPTPSLGQTLEWLRKELAEMQIQDQKLLLTLRHLRSVLEELRSESAHWEDAVSSRGTSPIRARAGSEGRGHQPVSSRRLAQLLQGVDGRRSSLP